MSRMKELRMDKLEQLFENEGVDQDEFLETYALDSVVPGICSNPDCDYCTEVEPDQNEGWCEFCEEGTVVSGLILLGVI